MPELTLARKPEWLQKRMNPGAHAEMERLLGALGLNTVCQEALCPNISECFRQKQATFLILGKACTRLCSFCNVTKAAPLPVDTDEPERVAAAILQLGLTHVVITSPTRDDLPDGGASAYAATVDSIRRGNPTTRIELLVPDFNGNQAAIEQVVGSGPDIFGHNLETIPRLYAIREGANYKRSLSVLESAREIAPAIPTKSGLMLGLGESLEEVRQVMEYLLAVGCSYLSLGQYLAPSRRHQPVAEFVDPQTFDLLRQEGLMMGFRHIESGPYVRSSYHAGDYQ